MRDTSVSSRVIEYLDNYLRDPKTGIQLTGTAAELHASMVSAGVLAEGDLKAVSALLSTMLRRGFAGCAGSSRQLSGRGATVYILDTGTLDYAARRGSSPGGNGGHARSLAGAAKAAQGSLPLAAPSVPDDVPRASQAAVSGAQAVVEPPLPPPPVDPLAETLRELREARDLLQGAAASIVSGVVNKLAGGWLRDVETAALLAELERRIRPVG